MSPLGRALLPFEGFRFRLVIDDPGDNLRSDDAVTALVPRPPLADDPEMHDVGPATIEETLDEFLAEQEGLHPTEDLRPYRPDGDHRTIAAKHRNSPDRRSSAMHPRQRRWKSPSFPSSASTSARAVVEGADDAERWLIARALEDAGFDVATCDGPTEQSGPCPLVAGRGCSALESADVVVNLLGLRRPAVQEIVKAVRAAAPEIGIVAEVSPCDTERLVTLLSECGCAVVSPLASARSVVATALQVAPRVGAAGGVV